MSVFKLSGVCEMYSLSTVLLLSRLDSMDSVACWCNDKGVATRSKVWLLSAPPPENWVHKKIPCCAVELNTQNCARFGSQISLITAMSFREAMRPPHPLPLDPAGAFVPQTACAPSPPPNPGCATDSRLFCSNLGQVVCAQSCYCSRDGDALRLRR